MSIGESSVRKAWVHAPQHPHWVTSVTWGLGMATETRLSLGLVFQRNQAKSMSFRLSESPRLPDKGEGLRPISSKLTSSLAQHKHTSYVLVQITSSRAHTLPLSHTRPSSPSSSPSPMPTKVLESCEPSQVHSQGSLSEKMERRPPNPCKGPAGFVSILWGCVRLKAFRFRSSDSFHIMDPLLSRHQMA